jgi:hypothetical protein
MRSPIAPPDLRSPSGASRKDGDLPCQKAQVIANFLSRDARLV